MTSDLLGQATWRSSDRTSLRNCATRNGSRLGGRRGGVEVRLGVASPSGSWPGRCICRFCSRFTCRFLRPLSQLESRAGGTRTPNLRFWRPVLYQLSYCPLSIAMPRTANRSQGRCFRLAPGPSEIPGEPRRRPAPGRFQPVDPYRVASSRSTPIGSLPAGRPLSGLLVQRVLAIPAAELLHLDPLAIVHLVLRRDVVPSFALLAGQGDLDALLVLCHGDSLLPDGRPGRRSVPMIALCPEIGSGGRTRTGDPTIMSRVL